MAVLCIDSSENVEKEAQKHPGINGLGCFWESTNNARELAPQAAILKTHQRCMGSFYRIFHFLLSCLSQARLHGFFESVNSSVLMFHRVSQTSIRDRLNYSGLRIRKNVTSFYILM